MISSVIQNPFEPTIGDEIVASLNRRNGEAGTFCAAVAFAKRSGVRLIINPLRQFISEGGECNFIIGIDQRGTSYEALHDLMDLGDHVHCYVNHCNDFTVTFHPKLYFVKNSVEAVVIAGSGNLTTGGLFTNDEFAVKQELNLTLEEDRNYFSCVENAFERMRRNDCISLNSNMLERLLAEHYLLKETEIQEQVRREQSIRQTNTSQIFNNTALTRRVRTDLITREAIQSTWHRRDAETLRISTSEIPVAPAVVDTASMAFNGFLMTLHQTDVGRGQINAGTSARSPEFFVPLAARDFAPGFWGWSVLFEEDQNHPGKFDRRVQMLFNGNVINVAMMTWPRKHDFRLRCEALRSNAGIGDILNVQQIPLTQGCDYRVEIIHTSDANHGDYLRLCENGVRNSQRRWGYYAL